MTQEKKKKTSFHSLADLNIPSPDHSSEKKAIRGGVEVEVEVGGRGN